MRTRICQIIPTLVQGGAEKQMSLLARHLDADRFESHVVVLTHSGPLESELVASGVQVHHIEKRGKLDALAIRRLIAKLKEIKPAVVHTWLFAGNSYGRLAARWAKVPVICAGERCVDPWKTWWHHAIDRFLLRFTDRIVTNSTGIREFYAKHGIPPRSFEVIPNAVLPTKTNSYDKQAFFERFGLEPRSRVVGSVGRLWKQKGYEDLIWAGELLRVAHGDLWYVIIGDGPELPQLQAFRDQVEAQHAVKFLGQCTDARDLIPAFDLLWNGSLYEGQSNTILEAMSAGVPVVATDIPGNQDLVDRDQTGLLYNVGDIETLVKRSNALLRDDGLRSQLGAAAEHKVRSEFSLERMVQSHEKLYIALLQEKGIHT